MGACQCNQLRTKDHIDVQSLACKADSSNRPSWMAIGRKGNRDVDPVQWGLTLRQWVQFVTYCEESPGWKACMTKYDRFSIDKNYVNLYDINHHFVKPWTRGTGSGVALMMNADTDGVAADLMVSHAWGADILQDKQVLQSWVDVNDVSMATVMWFCLFSLYQCGEETDDVGPTIAAQLQQEPFVAMIKRAKHKWGMIVVHTLACEIYERLWCVHEIDVAIQAKVPTFAIMSKQASEEMLKSPDKLVDTSEATCGSKSDEEAIRRNVLDNGGFVRLNRAIHAFRLNSVLQQAVIAGDLQSCKLALHATADPNVQDTRGRSCLHISASMQHLRISKLLIAARADILLMSAIGECPAHNLGLSLELASGADLLEHFSILAPGPHVWSLRSAFGVKVASRFASWARSAQNQDGSMYEPAQKALQEMERAYESVLRKSQHTPQYFDTFWKCTDNVRHFVLEIMIGTQGTSVPCWESDGDAQISLILLNAQMPRDLHQEKIDKVARYLCSRHALRLFSLSIVVQPIPIPSNPTLWEDSMNSLLRVIRALPIKGKVIFADDAGIAVPLCWELLPRLAGIISINPCCLHSEAFAKTEAWEKSKGHALSMSKILLGGDGTSAQIFGPMVNSLMHRCPDNDMDIERYYKASDEERIDRTLAIPLALSTWASLAHVKAMRKKSPLPLSLPTLVICGDSAPQQNVQDSCQRLVNVWFPSAQLRHVEDSKVWWLLEGEAQAAAMATHLDEFLDKCLRDHSKLSL